MAMEDFLLQAIGDYLLLCIYAGPIGASGHLLHLSGTPGHFCVISSILSIFAGRGWAFFWADACRGCILPTMPTGATTMLHQAAAAAARARKVLSTEYLCHLSLSSLPAPAFCKSLLGELFDNSFFWCVAGAAHARGRLEAAGAVRAWRRSRTLRAVYIYFVNYSGLHFAFATAGTVHLENQEERDRRPT